MCFMRKEGRKEGRQAENDSITDDCVISHKTKFNGVAVAVREGEGGLGIVDLKELRTRRRNKIF